MCLALFNKLSWLKIYSVLIHFSQEAYLSETKKIFNLMVETLKNFTFSFKSKKRVHYHLFSGVLKALVHSYIVKINKA